MNKKEQQWNETYLVGFGKHAKNKLLPALIKTNPNNISIVTKKIIDTNQINHCFESIDEALKNASKKSLFILSSPPNLHYKQAVKILNAGFDLMVEKPAFLSKEKLKEVQNISKRNGCLLIEMFMYMENDSFKKLTNIIKTKANHISKIYFDFIIPSVPKNTFRNESSLDTSLLADMGCYPLSFLSYAELGKNLNFTIKKRFINDNHPFFLIETKCQSINISIGCAKEYKNKIKIDFVDNSSVECERFFYGVPSEKEINWEIEGKSFNEKIYEKNAFEKLFLRTRESWRKSQLVRFEKMITITDNLIKLGNFLEIY
ncbi:hypothetical protein CL656_06785 [bacterium]|nr:hypothetical protein [bacterium]|tara:strand:- start:442 stop:1389 length:948 start_codon:yes stop_codon:yes gene_type:complete